MRLCIAQTKPVTADIEANIQRHKQLIGHALEDSADVIIFPELSLTGYEPTMAKELACAPDDNRFDEFQRITDDKGLVIGVGIPTKTTSGTMISTILFRPQNRREIYSKNYLHRDEEPFFVSGENLSVLKINDAKIGMAICYEISVPEHADNAHANGAQFYIASVNKSVTAITSATNRLGDIARTYSMTVLMSNCVGFCDGYPCAGKSSIWNSQGSLLGQLDDQGEGLLIIDTATQQVIERRIN